MAELSFNKATFILRYHLFSIDKGKYYMILLSLISLVAILIRPERDLILHY